MGGELEEIDRLLAQLPGEEPSRTQRPSSGRSYFAGPAPEQRAFLLPLRIPRGGYQSEPGTLARLWEGLAVPNIIHEPFQAANKLLERAYEPGQSDEEGVTLALQAAGLTGAGAIGTAPRNALLTGAARRQGPRSLPMDAPSRLSRAADMGFGMDETLYHGTYRNFRRFDPSRAVNDEEQAVWLTPNAEAAGLFGHYRVNADRLQDSWDGVRVMPLHLRSGRQRIVDREYLLREYGDEIAARVLSEGEDFNSPLLAGSDRITYSPEFFARELARARREGYDSVRFVGVDEGMGPPADQIAVLNPSNIRSTNARFDPRYRDSANLLSANPPPALLPSLMPTEGER